MLNMNELRYLIDESLIEYANDILSGLEEQFKGKNEEDYLSEFLDNDETFGTLYNDLKQTIEAMKNLDDSELYEYDIKDLNKISEDFDSVENKEELILKLNELITAVRHINI
jgi:hypothetical protein